MIGIKEKFLIFTVCSVALIPALELSAFSLEKQRIAVLEFHTGKRNGAFLREVRQKITARFLREGRFEVIDDTEIDSVEQNEEAYRSNGEISASKLGKEVRADKVVFYTIGISAGRYSADIQAIDVRSGENKFGRHVEAEKTDDLVSAIDEIIEELLDAIGFPDTPSIVGISKGEDELIIKWNEARRCEIYAIYRSRFENGPYAFLVKIKNTEYHDRNIDPGKKYWYRILALNNEGTSDFSAADYGYVPKPLSGYYLRSLVPGWAQIYAGEKCKGYTLLGVFAVAGSLTVYSGIHYRNSRDDYHRLGQGTTRDEFDEKYNAYRNSAYLFLGFGVITASLFVLSIVDSLLITKEEYMRITGIGEKTESFFPLVLACGMDASRGKIFLAGAGIRF